MGFRVESFRAVGFKGLRVQVGGSGLRALLFP